MANFPISRSNRTPSGRGAGVEIPLSYAGTQARVGSTIGGALQQLGGMVADEADKWDKLHSDIQVKDATKQAGLRLNKLADDIDREQDPDMYRPMYNQALSEIGEMRPKSARAAQVYDFWLTKKQVDFDAVVASAITTRLAEKVEVETQNRISTIHRQSGQIAMEDPDAAIEMLETNQSQIPEKYRQKYLSIGNLLVAKGSLSNPEKALEWLEKNKKRFDSDDYLSLTGEAKRLKAQSDAEYKTMAMDRVRQAAIGQPEADKPGSFAEAIRVLDGSVPLLPKDEQDEFSRIGYREIALALMNEDANAALEFMDSHQSKFDSQDFAALNGAAQRAIRETGGSTSTRSINAQADLLSSINDPQVYAQKLQQHIHILSPQARIEMARRFAMRDTVTDTNPDVFAKMLLRVGDYYITKDFYAAQREIGDARFGNVRVQLSEFEQEFAGIDGDLSVPSLSKQDYAELQGLILADVPQEMAVNVRNGLGIIQQELSNGSDKFTDESSRVVLAASKAFIATIQKNPGSYQDPQRASELATLMSIQLRPDAREDEVEPERPQSLVKSLAETAEKIAAQDPEVAYNRAAGPMGGFSAWSRQKNKAGIEDLLSTEEERQQVKEFRKQGLNDDQIIEKVAPTMFPSWFWKQVDGNKAVRGEVLRALSRKVSPAEIMLNARKGEEQ